MYAKVIILSGNKNTDREYSYCVPEYLHGKIKIGMKIIVPFGKNNKPSDAIITDFTNEIDIEKNKIKNILEIDPQNIFISTNHLELAKWMSEKYFCTLFGCLKLMIPNKKSQTRSFVLNNSYSDEKIIPKILTYQQQNTIDFINKKISSGDKKPILLHGVTGSGKTEVYFNLLEKIIARKKQAIVLLPEIALTTQMVKLFTARFQNKIGITHSKLTEREKFIQWQNAMQNKISIMLGPRSAIFTPFDNLGLIIMDEEHEASYQSETSPKYNTREVAEKICELTGANLILGSATPSIETYYRAQQNEINLVEMNERVNKKIPDIKIIDMREELASGNTKIFGRELFFAMQDALARGEQIILFLNRRGYSNFVSCRKCGLVLKCSACDVSYTFHSATNNLICHYCNEKASVPKICPSCGSKYIKSFGIGTQKVESETKKLFPDKNILRMDSDTVTKKSDYDRILKTFAMKKADILIGTQMIAKGLDFPNVSLVGIISADISLNTGDFHCSESTFQLLTQVSGRAGRAQTNALSFIQTYNPEHYSIVCAKNNDYKSFYEQEILFRQQMDYPPFSNIFCVLMTSPDEKLLIEKVSLLKKIMKQLDKKNQFHILGPAPAFISKIKNNYRQKILIKHHDEVILRKFVLFCTNILSAKKQLANIKLILTMNPIFMV